MSIQKLMRVAIGILALAVLGGRPVAAADTSGPAAAAARGPIVNLDDPTQLYTQWPQTTGVSVRLPASNAFAWPIDRVFRDVVMDQDGAGGSLFTRGDFGGAAGDVGLKIIFSGGPVRRFGATPTICYLGGETAGQDSRDTLRLNAIKFRRTGC